MADKFTISLHSNGYYSVSVPNYQGGEVVRGENYDALKQDHAVQAESITHLQSQQRVMKEAIEDAIIFIEMRREDADGVYSPVAAVRVKRVADAVLEGLRSAITPKGSEQ